MYSHLFVVLGDVFVQLVQCCIQGKLVLVRLSIRQIKKDDFV